MASFWPRVYTSTAAVPTVLGWAPSLTGVCLLLPMPVCACGCTWVCAYVRVCACTCGQLWDVGWTAPTAALGWKQTALSPRERKPETLREGLQERLIQRGGASHIVAGQMGEPITPIGFQRRDDHGRDLASWGWGIERLI